jgi:outer membrane immunogenic protein
MKKLFLGSVALVALGLVAPAAFAAERPVPYTPPPPPVPVYTWTGCYVGASAGTSNGHSDGFSTTPGSTALGLGPGGTNIPLFATQLTGSFDLSGFIGGGQLGCNLQVGVWVWGVEVDGSATNKSGQQNAATGPNLAIGPNVFQNPLNFWELQERWLVTARGRLGWTIWDKTMVYVTGGAAWAKIDSSLWVIGNQIATGIQQTNTRSGWTVGGGLEYALGYGWSVKGEFLYVDFGDWNTLNCVAVGPGCPTGTITNVNVNLKDYVWRAGMNYKFW